MCNRGERVECGADRRGKPGREELDAYKYFEKKSSGSFLYQLFLAVIFQYNMVILSDMLEFECLACIECTSSLCNPRTAKGSMVASQSWSKLYHCDQEPARQVWKNALKSGNPVYGNRFPYGAVSEKGLWRASRTTSNAAF